VYASAAPRRRNRRAEVGEIRLSSFGHADLGPNVPFGEQHKKFAPWDETLELNRWACGH